MPIYEYKCLICEKHHEIMRKITDKPLLKCPDCGGRMKKMISNTTFVLKGTGWYATDYASDKRQSSHPKTSKAEKTATEGAKTVHKTETKTETKSVVKEAAVSR